MNTVTIILLVILVILTGILIALYFTGKRLQKKQNQRKSLSLLRMLSRQKKT